MAHVKKERNKEVNLLVYQPVFTPSLRYGHRICTNTKERVDKQIALVEISFLHWEAGLSLRSGIRRAEQVNPKSAILDQEMITSWNDTM